MSVRQQVEDATFLAQNGRHLGAFTILLISIAASSRKCFPKKTKSFEKPVADMSDREAFTLFLGGGIRNLLLGNYGGPEFGSSGILVSFKSKQYDIADILYKFYRCELVHEGDLPEDVEFAPSGDSGHTGLNIEEKAFGVSISVDNKMVLGHGWIDLLTRVVVQARCNGPEFGIKHFNLMPKPNIINERVFLDSIVAKYSITPGRFQVLKHAVQLISPEVINASEDDRLVDHFGRLVSSGEISGGAITGLSGYGLTDPTGRLQPKGLVILREIAAVYELVVA